MPRVMARMVPRGPGQTCGALPRSEGEGGARAAALSCKQSASGRKPGSGRDVRETSASGPRAPLAPWDTSEGPRDVS